MNNLSYGILMASAALAASCWAMLVLVNNVDDRRLDRAAEYYIPRATLLTFSLVMLAALLSFLGR
jgi:hypothetical protein